MSKIILLMGIDGCGKSSLTSILQKELTNKGIRSVVVWASLRPVLMKPFIVVAKYLLVRKHNKFDDYEKHITVKNEGMKKMSWARHIYLLITFLDYLPQVFFKVFLPRLIGKVVICDRYYPDLVLDYGVTTLAPASKTDKLLKYAEKIFPVPDLHYYLKVPSDVALARKDDIPSLEYLERRAEIYERFASIMGSTILDGTKPLEVNSEKLIGDILAAMGKS